jgi:hypothetical protein
MPGLAPVTNAHFPFHSEVIASLYFSIIPENWWVASDGKRFEKQIQMPNENQAFPFGRLALPTRRPRLSRLAGFLSFLK